MYRALSCLAPLLISGALFAQTIPDTLPLQGRLTLQTGSNANEDGWFDPRF